MAADAICAWQVTCAVVRNGHRGVNVQRVVLENVDADACDRWWRVWKERQKHTTHRVRTGVLVFEKATIRSKRPPLGDRTNSKRSDNTLEQ